MGKEFRGATRTGALIALLALAACAGEFYVSPAGRPSGDGSMEAPWDLTTALAHPKRVRPMDTIWLRGGTYRGRFASSLKGAENAPIVVRQYPGEWVVLDGESACGTRGQPRPDGTGQPAAFDDH